MKKLLPIEERFIDKNIWIIGASEGIGRCLAQALAANGASVCVSGRNAGRLNELCDSIGGRKSMPLAFDVTQKEEVWKAYAELTKKWKRIDYFIFNAGAYEPQPAVSFDSDNVETAIKITETNLTSIYNLLGLIIPNMVATGDGNIVLTASVAGYYGLPGSFAYGASKAALINLAETLKLELDSRNINVQVVNPGFVKTRLTDKNDFKMTMMITPEEAAEKIIKDLGTQKFEIHFPKAFSMMMKFLKLLPYPLFFPIVRRITRV